MFAHFSRKRPEPREKKLSVEEQAKKLMFKHKITLDEARDLIKKGQKSLDSFKFR